jgi:hypothetical protein
LKKKRTLVTSLGFYLVLSSLNISNYMTNWSFEILWLETKANIWHLNLNPTLYLFFNCILSLPWT